jgi:hypothetical protein
VAGQVWHWGCWVYIKHKHWHTPAGGSQLRHLVACHCGMRAPNGVGIWLSKLLVVAAG